MDIQELEAGIIKSIKEATIEVCSTMLMLEVKDEESYVKDEKKVSTDLISSLHFFGDNYMGKIGVFSSGIAAAQLAEAMLGSPVNKIDDEVKDCMGEIVNMIAGGAKTKLMDTMGLLHLLTPWVIAGKNIKISSHKPGDDNLTLESRAQFSWIMTRFSFNGNHFTVGVQPNAVPDNSINKSDLDDKLKELEKENRELKNSLTNLKS